MGKTFETERLVLRPFQTSDFDDIYEQVYSDPEVCIYYCGPVLTKTKTKRWLQYRIMEAQYSDFYAWAVEVKELGKVIGLVRLGPYVNSFNHLPEDPFPPFNPIDVELSFAFGQTYWGRGYALEASKRIIDYAFQTLGLPRLVNGIVKENLRSVRFHEKLGYRVSKNLVDDDLEGLLENPGRLPT